jgi:soluble lytic murein transglycosylase
MMAASAMTALAMEASAPAAASAAAPSAAASPASALAAAQDRCVSAPSALLSARTAWREGDAVTARAALAAVAGCDLTPEGDVAASLLLAQAALALDDPDAALAALDALPPLADLTLPDLALWLRAEALARAGAPADALPLLDQVIAQRASPWHHVARVARARNLFAAKDYAAAAADLTALIRDYPEQPQAERLWLLRAQSRQALGLLVEAAADYDRVIFEWPFKDAAKTAQAALSSLPSPPARPYAERFDRAKLLRTGRHWDLAEAAFADLLAEVATASGTSEAENRIHHQLALNAYGASRYDVAIPRLERLLSVLDASQGAGLSRADVLEHLVRCNAYSGQFDQALSWVIARDRALSERARAEKMAAFLEDNGRFPQALGLWDSLLSDADKGTWHYAFLLFNAGQDADAIKRLQRLADTSQGQARARALYWSARAHARLNRVTAARAIYEDIQTRYPLDYYGYQATNRLLELDAPAPPPYLIAGAKDDPAASPLGVGSRDEGFASASEGLTPPAIAAPPPAAAPPSESEVALPTASGLTPAPSPFAAAPATSSAASSAASSLAATPAASAPPHLTPTGDARIYWDGPPPTLRTGTASAYTLSRFSAEPVAASPWTAYDTAEPIEGALHLAANTWGDLYPDLRRADALWSAGLPTESRRTLRAVALEHRGLLSRASGNKRPLAAAPWALVGHIDALLVDHRGTKRAHWGLSSSPDRWPVPADLDGKKALAARQRAILDAGDALTDALHLAMKEAGDYHLLRRAAAPKASGLPDDAADATRERWSEAYPRAFPERVSPLSAAHGLNPYLLWGIIHIESSFNPDSISHANARGLLQVIPMTGIKIATAMGIDDYGPADLLDPNTSLRFGAWYMAQLVQKFHGQEPLAIIGYNGGPHFVARWLAMRGHALELDAFIETVPFDEARNYVKKALRVIGSYRRLYHGQPILYLGNALDPTFLPLPNY